MLGKKPKPKCETHMLSTHQIQTQNILYKARMAVIYQLRPGMAFITKTQPSKVSSFSEVDALEQNQTQEISGGKRTEFLLFLRCQKQREHQCTAYNFLPKCMWRRGNPSSLRLQAYLFHLLGCMASGLWSSSHILKNGTCTSRTVKIKSNLNINKIL